jgi:hypothetical protein
LIVTANEFKQIMTLADQCHDLTYDPPHWDEIRWITGLKALLGSDLVSRLIENKQPVRVKVGEWLSR